MNSHISVFLVKSAWLYLCGIIKHFFMNTYSINLIVPQGWHELNNAQLRYVYSLIAKEFSADEIKTLALLKWATLKVRVEGLGVREKYVK